MNQTLLLIDGMSFVYRAFHAIPPLTSPSGAPTNATYGVISMLQQLQKKYPTTHIACIFDAKGKTFRDDIHAEYKANRAPTPDDLISQLADIYAIIPALGIPVLSKPGVEADDVIGTIALVAKKLGSKVWIATGDKDFAQLVDEDITLVNTMSNEILDVAGVIKKFGVKPCQIIDYLSLVGDKADNVPGVPGCGPKTAVKWLTEYGTLDNIIANADKINGSVGENLRQTISWLATAKELITINTQLELSIEYDDEREPQLLEFGHLVCGSPDISTLRTYYSQLGFKTWLKQLDTPAEIQVAAVTTKSQHIVEQVNAKVNTSVTQLCVTASNMVQVAAVAELTKIVDDLVVRANSPIGLLMIADHYPDATTLKFVAIATNSHVYIVHNNRPADDLFADTLVSTHGDEYTQELARLFTSNIPKVLVSSKDTLQLLSRLNLGLNNITGDITLAHYIKNSRQKHTLSSIFQEYLQLTAVDMPSFSIKPGKDAWYLHDDVDTIIANIHMLSQAILPLESKILSELDEQERYLYRGVELPLARILVNIESAGITLDIKQFDNLDNELTTQIATLEDKIYSEAGTVFNINSPQQLQDVLFNQMKLPTDGIKKNSNGFSTDENTLNILADNGCTIAILMLEYRTLSKLLNTYVNKLPQLVDKAAKVHTTFEQALVASGRLSSRDPNLQNIPIRTNWGKRIRKCFIASPGCTLICADYSQIELRILAQMSNDESLIAAFNAGADIHTITASEIFQKAPSDVSRDERRYAKTINFSLIYGKTAFGLAQELKIDRATAAAYIEAYFAKYPKVKVCLEQIKAFAHEHGYVATLLGRRIYLPNINAQNRMLREAEERLALNAPMQGTSADIIKLAMLNIAKWLHDTKLKTKMVLQVHDELVLDVPDNEIQMVQTNLAQLMADVVSFKVKLEVSIRVATNWGEA